MNPLPSTRDIGWYDLCSLRVSDLVRPVPGHRVSADRAEPAGGADRPASRPRLAVQRDEQPAAQCVARGARGARVLRARWSWAWPPPACRPGGRPRWATSASSSWPRWRSPCSAGSASWSRCTSRPTFRCYDRMSIFIAFFALATLALLASGARPGTEPGRVARAGPAGMVGRALGADGAGAARPDPAAADPGPRPGRGGVPRPTGRSSRGSRRRCRRLDGLPAPAQLVPGVRPALPDVRLRPLPRLPALEPAALELRRDAGPQGRAAAQPARRCRRRCWSMPWSGRLRGRVRQPQGARGGRRRPLSRASAASSARRRSPATTASSSSSAFPPAAPELPAAAPARACPPADRSPRCDPIPSRDYCFDKRPAVGHNSLTVPTFRFDPTARGRAQRCAPLVRWCSSPRRVVACRGRGRCRRAAAPPRPPGPSACHPTGECAALTLRATSPSSSRGKLPDESSASRHREEQAGLPARPGRRRASAGARFGGPGPGAARRPAHCPRRSRSATSAATPTTSAACLTPSRWPTPTPAARSASSPVCRGRSRWRPRWS